MKRVFAMGLVLVILGGVALAAQPNRGNVKMPARVSVKTAPPVIVKTVPQAGDADVDPNIKEIQVTFSKTMATEKNWSWVQISRETFPQAAGEIHYLEDQKTCVMPVKLQPGHTYVIWLNQGEYNSFRDADGQAAVPYLLVFETKK